MIGEGSEVQGFDDEMSTDHMWGAKSFVFVRGRMLVWSVSEALEMGWPAEHAGMPVLPPRVVDGDGVVTRIRSRLSWYPEDVWRWLLAAGWTRVGQELQFVGRTGFVGDDLGSRIVAARVARDLMRLSFLVERRYAPYAKWLGTAFARLDAGPAVGALLGEALSASSWEPREQALASAAEAVALRQLALGLHEPFDVSPRPYFTRPFPVVPANELVAALVDGIGDPVLRRSARIVGNADLATDSVDLAGDHRWARLHASWFTSS